MYTFCTNKNSLTTLENGSQNMGEKKKKKNQTQRRTCIHNLSQNTTTKHHKANHYFQTIAFGWFSAACLLADGNYYSIIYMPIHIFPITSTTQS